MAKLYVIDQTSRMYGFDFDETGLNVTIDGVEHTVTPTNTATTEIEQSLRSNGTIVVVDPVKGATVFSGSHLIGVQYRLNE